MDQKALNETKDFSKVVRIKFHMLYILLITLLSVYIELLFKIKVGGRIKKEIFY